MITRVCWQSLPVTVSSFCLFCLAFACFVIPVSVIASEEDDYLKALSLEVQKVERKSPSSDSVPDAQDTSNKATAMGSGEGFSPDLSMDTFEVELQERYTGSAVFYGKLLRAESGRSIPGVSPGSYYLRGAGKNYESFFAPITRA